ncbi:hypothetical protein [Burkholderia ubonensis]
MAGQDRERFLIHTLA